SIRIAILGAGGWGKNLVRVFCELLGENAVTVVDPEPTRRNAAKLNHPGIAVAGSPKWSELDAAVIAAPAPLHYQLASEALDAGLHVLAEKPLALASEHVRTLIEMAESKERILMVDHLLEYHPAVVQLKSLVEDGTLGKIRHMTSQRLNLGIIRSEENAWWSLAPHDVSIVLHLMNGGPATVSAVGGTYLQDGIPDVAHATLQFEDGAMAHIHVSWLEPVKTRRLTIVGERAMAVFDDMSDDKLVLRNDEIQIQNGRYAIDKAQPVVQEIAGIEPLRSMAETFLDSIRSGTPPRSDGWDGLRVVRVLEAVQRSMDQGGKIVRMENYDA
ncbi:Gfo/Idh/MocA family oxidoreductase, partial [Candidatus Bipolaricaulota bacterium]|nr:Gfo/Idh/MocA family oxidoreductase [Candidatus Bipolaricaulota bacterium]